MADKLEAEQSKAYEPTERECRVIEAHNARREAMKPRPHLKVTNAEDGRTSIDPDHVDLKTASKLIMEATGTCSYDFFTGLMDQLARLNRTGGKVSEEQLNFMLAAINGAAPRDEAESMLAAQMATIHMATMKVAGNLAHATQLPQFDSASNALNKLARTYALQLEALKKYRRGGEQTVNVKHVHVHEGGQAIVSNVSNRKGATSKLEGQPQAQHAITDAPQREVPSALTPDGQTMPQRRHG